MITRSVSAFALFNMVSLMAALEAGAQDQGNPGRPALPFPPGISLESQCGIVDDLQHVEFYDGTLGVTEEFVATHEKSTFQLQWRPENQIRQALPDHAPGNVGGQRWCTATLIGAATALTAGHCFDIGDGSNGWITPFRFDENGRPDFAEPAVIATLLVANFGYQLSAENGALRDPDMFPVVALTEYRLGGLDYAIIELGADADGRMPSDLGHPAARLDIRDVNEQEQLTIIQHPQGDPKKIEAGSALQTQGSDLLYDNIDTHGGSSGSGVRDDDGDVVAVHTNGGCQRTGPGANRGVLLTSIATVSSGL